MIILISSKSFPDIYPPIYIPIAIYVTGHCWSVSRDITYSRELVTAQLFIVIIFPSESDSRVNIYFSNWKIQLLFCIKILFCLCGLWIRPNSTFIQPGGTFGLYDGIRFCLVMNLHLPTPEKHSSWYSFSLENRYVVARLLFKIICNIFIIYLTFRHHLGTYTR